MKKLSMSTFFMLLLTVCIFTVGDGTRNVQAADLSKIIAAGVNFSYHSSDGNTLWPSMLFANLKAGHQYTIEVNSNTDKPFVCGIVRADNWTDVNIYFTEPGVSFYPAIDNVYGILCYTVNAGTADLIGIVIQQAQ